MARRIHEEYIDEYMVIEYADFELKHPSFLVLGLPDAGMVGSITAMHLIKILNMSEVGGIDSYRLPPIAVVHKGEVKPPIRIFVSENVMVVISEVTPPAQTIYSLAYLITEYALRKSIDYVVSSTGLPAPNRLDLEKLHVYAVPSNNKALELARKANIEIFEGGYLVGPYAAVLKECIKRRVPNLVLLAESFLEFPDPEASAAIVTTFGKILGTELSVGELLEQAEVIKLKLRDHMKSVTRMMAQMQKGYEHKVPLVYM